MMRTKTIVKKAAAKANQPGKKIAVDITDNGENEFKDLAIYKIDYSPFNYRKLFSEKDLDNFAAEISQHGIISPLTVRLIDSGNYELVTGERRLRAATLAGLVTVPVVIKEYTDEQVIEIQLAENLQRESPHPLHEAFAIGQMQSAGKKIDEISARLGKSKQFIYTRLKLLLLIEPVQEMLLNDVINLLSAIEIASVSAESQTEFFQSYCRDWKKRKNFEISNLSHKLDQFKYDLKKAPFNTKDKKLIPGAGACNTCASNTATHKSLFPEFAKQAICNNRECYQKKCDAHFTTEFRSAFLEHQPDAFIFNGEPSDMINALIQSVAGADDLPTYSRYDIEIINPPEMPGTDDYTNEEENEEGEEESSLDEKGFNEAMEEYEEEMGEYKMLMQSGKLQKGLLVMENSIKLLAFSPEKQIRHGGAKVITAKEVQAAIKNGTATGALLQSEIDRINNKEIRAKELDREKIQLAVHEKFSTAIADVSNNTSLTDADRIAARLIIYQSLDYHSRSKVDTALFPATNDDLQDRNIHFYQQLADLGESGYAYLIRSALTCKADSKFPSNLTGFFLYKLAESAGVNTEAIEQLQEQKAITRQTKQKEKIKELEKQISKLKTTA